MKTKKSLLNLIFWISLSMMFNIFIFYSKGERAAWEYFGGYIVEMSLSLDNLFLFLMVFSSFKIREEYQERVLLYGVIGAMVLRLIFILLGVAIISQFSMLLSIFGVILLISGFKMFSKENDAIEVKDNFAVKVLNLVIPITNDFYENKFIIKRNGVTYATPLLAALLVIEFSDIIFAIDSIPAIFSITTNTFIVYTSNIFAILGLRSMYYILQKMNNMFKFMKYGVGAILIFTGLKLVLIFWGIEISVTNSVLIISIILLSSILISSIWNEIAKLKIR